MTGIFPNLKLMWNSYPLIFLGDVRADFENIIILCLFSFCYGSYPKILIYKKKKNLRCGQNMPKTKFE